MAIHCLYYSLHQLLFSISLSIAVSYRASRPLRITTASFISATVSVIIFLSISFCVCVLLFRGFLSSPYICFLAIVEAVGAFSNKRVSGGEAIGGRVRERIIERVKNKVIKEVKKGEEREYLGFIRIYCSTLLIILLVIYTNLNLNSSLFIDFLFFLDYLYLYIICRGSLVAIRLPNIDINNRSIY